MKLIALLVILYVFSSVFRWMDHFFSAFRSVLNSWPGILAVVAVSAWLAYRWYRDRYIS